LLGHDARDHVGAAARGRTDEDANRAVRVVGGGVRGAVRPNARAYYATKSLNNFL
jgi:hypothetical protein